MKTILSFISFSLSLFFYTQAQASCSQINGFYACGPGQQGPLVCAIFAHQNEMVTVAMAEGNARAG